MRIRSGSNELLYRSTLAYQADFGAVTLLVYWITHRTELTDALWIWSLNRWNEENHITRRCGFGINVVKNSSYNESGSEENASKARDRRC